MHEAKRIPWSYIIKQQSFGLPVDVCAGLGPRGDEFGRPDDCAGDDLEDVEGEGAGLLEGVEGRHALGFGGAVGLVGGSEGGMVGFGGGGDGGGF